MQVKWLKTAIRNLDSATAYVARENPETARKMYAYIRRRVDALAERPEIGRPGRVFGTRELVIDKYPYIVPYRIRGNEVQIIRVFHTSQKPPDVW